MTDVRLPSRAKNSIGNRMAQHISIRMAIEPKRVGDFNPTEDQWPVGDQAVNIIADAGRNHSSGSVTLPLVATMEYFSGWDSWGFNSTVPPACSTRRSPAATSQRLIMPST